MNKSMMLIINPKSGRGLSKTALGTIVSNLCEVDYAVTVYISHEKYPEELAFEYAEGHDLVVCVGGDGTLSNVISGLLRAKLKIPVGYIPAGTSNDVATTLALTRDPSIAARKILSGTPTALDIGLFKDRYFTYIAAFGAFTGVAYTTPQNAKRSLGHLAYVFGGLADMAAIAPRRTVVKYDDKVIEGEFIFGGVVNSTSVAGLVKLNPELVDLADGEFEVILVRQPVVLTDFMEILTSLVMQTYEGDNFLMLHASSVSFTFDEEVAWTVDGEDGGLHKNVEIENCHKAIKIVL
ncbi:MAG: YegS/Rv2252/BmrU family lipid kinase [Oscillospiraceae bacterium]|nr:YegS/Rv2252/BmrU family lipid kinase [Oscillospiraceae bacterium]MCL2279944.1 YegS/Rv2252/BmrU family lipid kinase [Oscillospiraceae bacterium]